MQNRTMQQARSEIAARAARLVVEDGMDYGSAKRRAARECGVAMERGLLPDNHELEQAVRQYQDLFHAEPQARALLALRRHALLWMNRLAPYRPHLCGSVWTGTADERSAIQLELFCDDTKLAEISLLNMGFKGLGGAASNDISDGVISSIVDRCEELAKDIHILASINDYDLIRGGLRADRHGRIVRASPSQVQRLLEESSLV